MTPQEIARLRQSAEALETTIQQLRAQCKYAEADALTETAGDIWASVLPFCWCCGKRLTIADAGDHLCNQCIGDLPLGWPD